jgi:hypothetical protein
MINAGIFVTPVKLLMQGKYSFQALIFKYSLFLFELFIILIFISPQIILKNVFFI